MCSDGGADTDIGPLTARDMNVGNRTELAETGGKAIAGDGNVEGPGGEDEREKQKGRSILLASTWTNHFQR